MHRIVGNTMGFAGVGGGGEDVRLYFIHGGAVVARNAGKKSEGEPYERDLYFLD